MTYPGPFTYPGDLLFPGSLLGNWPPPGKIPRTVGRRPQRPVSVALAGSVPPVPPWRPAFDLDAPFDFDVDLEVSLSMSVTVDVPITFDPIYVASATGGSVEELVDVPMSFEVELDAVPGFAVDAPIGFEVDLDLVKASWLLADNFNRADGAPGALWAQRRVTGTTDAVIAGNAIQAGVPSATSGANATNQTALVYTTAMNSDDFSSEAVVVSTPGAGYFAGVLVRSDLEMDNYVIAVAAGRDDSVGLWTCIDGTWTRRATFATNAFTAGDLMIVEAVSSTYRLKRSRSGTVSEIASWTDNGNLTKRGASYRHGGLYVVSVRSTFNTTYGPKLDDWAARPL